MVDDNRAGGLLRVQLEFLGQFHAYAIWLQDVHQNCLLLKVRAGRIPERVTRSSIALLANQGVHIRIVARRQPQFFAYPGVPVLRQGLGELHR